MRDPLTFEARLRDAFLAYADGAPTTVDATILAAAVAGAGHGRGWRRVLVSRTSSLLWLRRAAGLALVALAIAALIALQLLIGGARRLPPPFGPAANGLIAFELEGDVYVGDPGTASKRLVLGGRALESNPTFSPDGTRIAVIESADAASPSRVVVVGVDGSNPIVVTPNALDDLTWVDWTPDGRQLALVARAGAHMALLLADATGRGVTTLVGDLDVDVPDFRPPDGREIVFRAMTANGPGIFLMNADGSGRHALVPPAATNNPEYDLRQPRWSPDGAQIAYMAWDQGLRQMRTWIMRADGTGKRQLPHDPRAWFEGWPAWSPDGTRLILTRQFVDSTGRPLDNTRPFAVGWVDGRAPVVETGPPMSTGREHASWSPDGRSILLQGTSQEFILDPAGGPWRTLPWATDTYPAWQRVAP